jgi:hypothetical protein
MVKQSIPHQYAVMMRRLGGALPDDPAEVVSGKRAQLLHNLGGCPPARCSRVRSGQGQRRRTLKWQE